jgi:hypothetical protein
VGRGAIVVGLAALVGVAAAAASRSSSSSSTPPGPKPAPPGKPPKPGAAGESLDARERATLAAVRAGRADLEWLPIKSSAGGHTARFWVLADALRIDGVRVNAGARLQQEIADLLGARLLTPRLSDLRFEQAQIRIPPQPMPIAASLAAEREHSARVDRAIVKVAGKLGAARGRIVSTVGKDWTIGNALQLHPGRGQNYGWHFAGRTFEGIAGHPSSSPGVSVIQPAATVHGLDQNDYSQTVVLVRQGAELDGDPAQLDRILQDPKLAALASSEGPLRVVRQPGVTPLERLST